MPVIGAAMVVHMKGIENFMIMTLGRWKAMLCENTLRTLSSTLLPHRYSNSSSQSPSIPPSPRRLAFSVTIMFVRTGIKGISVS